MQNSNVKIPWHLVTSVVLSVLVTYTSACSPTTVIKGQEECVVCKANGDLACVLVAPNATTPTAMSGGKTYYFCSQECLEEFARQPELYSDKAHAHFKSYSEQANRPSRIGGIRQDRRP